MYALLWRPDHICVYVGASSDQDDDEKYDFDDQGDHGCDDHHDKVLLDTDKILIGLIGY